LFYELIFGIMFTLKQNQFIVFMYLRMKQKNIKIHVAIKTLYCTLK